ncbi:hypothetical protein [Pantanalinema sp. GBBB05]|uniref:hypothetical protein n=1 Tax=Pantanalinema sp. GBBB05 TaxID=2604139 RepID=UPI001D753463|nr:hypothetical protein [Pantanalinema sp. GBBB05]
MPQTGKYYVEPLNMRMPTTEMKTLWQSCGATYRTQSDVTWPCIRRLESATVTLKKQRVEEIYQ